MKILDARWHQVQSVPNIESVHHVIPINIGTTDIALTTKSTHKKICSLSHSDKDASINNLLISAVVGDFVEVVLFSTSKKTSKILIAQIKQMDGENMQIKYPNFFQIFYLYVFTIRFICPVRILLVFFDIKNKTTSTKSLTTALINRLLMDSSLCECDS